MRLLRAGPKISKCQLHTERDDGGAESPERGTEENISKCQLHTERDDGGAEGPERDTEARSAGVPREWPLSSMGVWGHCPSKF